MYKVKKVDRPRKENKPGEIIFDKNAPPRREYVSLKFKK
jgi:hypothetical protein